jgi:superfamily II DNA/RNA helicase
MLDMGFIPDIERIFKLTPAKKQTLFFSATTAETITQYLVRLPTSDPKAKRTALRMLIGADDVRNGIVFCNRKSEVDIVAKSLKAHGLDAAPIHGDLDQQTRMRTLEAFRKGELKLLCASDVAARGLDVPDVSHVFNYDVPHHADDYVHRIGRTGRAGKSGKTYMIVTPADAKNIDKVLKLIGKAPEEITLEGVDFASIKDERRDDRGRSGGGRERGGRTRDHAPRPGRNDRPVRPEASVEPISAPEASGEPAAEAPRRERRPRRGSEERRPVEAHDTAEVVQDRPARAPREERAPRESRPARDERPAREERSAREDRPAREERPGRDRGRRDQREPREDRGEREDRSGVVGFGSDTPAFLMRSSSRPTPKT